jgi:hypothetical protein
VGKTPVGALTERLPFVFSQQPHDLHLVGAYAAAGPSFTVVGFDL